MIRIKINPLMLINNELTYQLSQDGKTASATIDLETKQEVKYVPKR